MAAEASTPYGCQKEVGRDGAVAGAGGRAEPALRPPEDEKGSQQPELQHSQLLRDAGPPSACVSIFSSGLLTSFLAGLFASTLTLL